MILPGYHQEQSSMPLCARAIWFQSWLGPQQLAFDKKLLASCIQAAPDVVNEAWMAL